MKVPSEFMLAIDSKWAGTLGTSFFLLAFRKVVHPPLQDGSLRSSDFFFCRHHLDWISLRHSVLTKSSVLRLALASMRTGQPEAGHPRNLYRVGRASSSPAQATGWRPTGGTPGRRGSMAHGLAVTLLAGIRRDVVRVGAAACLKCRGGMHGFIQIEKVSHISPRGRDNFPMLSENAREGGCRPSRS